MRKVIATGLEPPAYGPRQPKVTQLQPFERYLRERLAVVPELTGRRLHRELAAMGYHGGYTAVTDLLRELRPITSPWFEVRFETPPGRQAQVDFAHFRTVFTDEPGVERVVWLFSMVLGHSRLLWGRFVPQRDMLTVLRCHAAAFEALGGSPAEILYDRMKTVVDREAPQDGPEPGHIVYNRTLVEFARHYGYLPKACKANRAKTKGKVERPFRYIREDFFLGRSFRSRDDLNVQFRQWLDEVANVRVHATTQRVVSEHFAEERPWLKSLPAGPFQAVLRLERRITKDGMVSVDGNLYSVPDTTRTHSVCHDIAWLFSDRRYPGELAFPGLAIIGMVESQTKRDGRVERERRYYLCSTKLDAKPSAASCKAIGESKTACTGRSTSSSTTILPGHGPTNMAVVKHMALNLLRQAKPTASLKNRRKRASWNNDYLANVIQQTA